MQQRKLIIWATRIPSKTWGKHNATEKTNNMGNTDPTKTLGKHNATEKTNNMGNTDPTKNLG